MADSAEPASGGIRETRDPDPVRSEPLSGNGVPGTFQPEILRDTGSRVHFCSRSRRADLDSILCVKHTRKTDAAGTFSFKNRCFQILDEGFPIINARREITVLVNPRFGIRVKYGGRVYDTIRYLKPQNKNASIKIPQKVRTTVEPHLQLRHSSKEWKAIW